MIDCSLDKLINKVCLSTKLKCNSSFSVNRINNLYIRTIIFNNSLLKIVFNQIFRQILQIMQKIRSFKNNLLNIIFNQIFNKYYK